MSIVNLTANSRMLTSMMGYCTQTHTLAELISVKYTKAPRGLCLNKLCKFLGAGDVMVYQQKARPRMYHTDSKIDDCPYCKHALFWTSSFRLIHRAEYIKQKDALKAAIDYDSCVRRPGDQELKYFE
jgi:hypothetical protein